MIETILEAFDTTSGLALPRRDACLNALRADAWYRSDAAEAMGPRFEANRMPSETDGRDSTCGAF